MRRYLEIGCGTGYLLSGIAAAYLKAKVTGSEIFCVGLPYAASRVEMAELLQMDARQIPYVDEYGVIGAFDVLEHIDEDETVLSGMYRALRPGRDRHCSLTTSVVVGSTRRTCLSCSSLPKQRIT